jgi:type I restriction enzyme S subunit
LIDIYATGGGQPNVNQETIAALRIPAPSVTEQCLIANYLELELAKLQQLVDNAQQAVSLLLERRSALITAAVTGQIDLREAA